MKSIKVKSVNVLVNKSLVEIISKQVMIHEIPLLKVKLGESNVSLSEFQPSSTVEIEPRTEMGRLVRFYGEDENKNNIAESVYGNANVESTYTKDSPLIVHMGLKDPQKLFDGVAKNTVKAPSSNDENADKALKSNLTKPEHLAWFKDQGIEETKIEGETVALSSLKAADLTSFADEIMRGMIDEYGVVAPDAQMGTKGLSRIVLDAQANA